MKLFAWLLALVVGSAWAAPLTEALDPAVRREQIEADWISQVTQRRPPDTRDDALGAVDGIKNGKWAFHTGFDVEPWWQVDLGSVQPLARAVIYNRCDAAGRAANLMVLLSEDGKQWREAYRHNGQVFYGATDGKPLVVNLGGAQARFLRVQLPGQQFLHLDEVEVYGVGDEQTNLALWKEADQSSISPWSVPHPRPGGDPVRYNTEEVIARGRRLAEDLREAGVPVAETLGELDEVAADLQATPAPPPADQARKLFLRARWAVRKLAFSNPLLDFDRLLLTKRVPSSFSHMSDQHYGWWSRPGGGLFILEHPTSDAPRLISLTADMPEGNILYPDVSYDGQRILFAYCRYHPEVSGLPDKFNKANVPEDAFYHIFEIKADGTGLRQLTHGRYDDFNARYLPNGEIVFLSTRRGQFVQCSKATAESTRQADLPDSFVRCGGDAYRPVSVYTLHVMDADGGNIRCISPFENFEWYPTVTNDGRIMYARWDYVDRNNMPYMSLWATHPDGSNTRLVYGNFTPNPHCIFEARPIPDSDKIIFTASAHHCITGGSLCLLDPFREFEGLEALTRLTPEVCFPESEGWPMTFFSSPYPLSEKYYLVDWGDQPLQTQGSSNAGNATGIYLYDCFGNLELLYRDPAISSMYPMPLRPRPKPPVISSSVTWEGAQEARLVLLDVYQGLGDVPRDAVKSLRIVAVPAKTQPWMNTPNLGVTSDDPGKCVLGTVPVEADGSAFFRVPSGVPLFFQALDRDGIAIQTMRTVTYLQPGQTTSCVGCHEPRNLAPRLSRPMAVVRAPSKITPGPEGSWPLRYDRLVQPVLDRHCVSCHRPDGPHEAARKLDLTPASSYEALISYGNPSLRDHVRARYYEGRSVVGHGAAQDSPLLALLRREGGHHGVELDADSLARLVTWIDTYGQRQGSFSEDQEKRLVELRAQMAGMLCGP